MPGWILVANRFSLLTTIGKNGGILSTGVLSTGVLSTRALRGIVSLICLCVLSGCSNIRQQSLDLPLPILPSQAAVDADAIGAPDVPATEDNVVASNAVENGSALDSKAFKNDFDASEFTQDPSVQNFLPSENDFQPPQLQARFVGVMDKAEMTDVKLKAVSNEVVPAPAITQASHEAQVSHEDAVECKTPEACKSTETAQCDCCKKKELPKLAVVEPVDPEQLPDLFGANRKIADDDSDTDIPFQTSLRPIESTNVAPAAKDALVAKVSSPPIRLTAMPDSEMLQARLQSAVTGPTPPQNKAQLLIPIAPEALREFKADSDRATAQAIKTLESRPTIKVSPIMDLNSALAARSSTDDTDEPVVSVSASKSLNLIPVSSEGIRVSQVPFKSLPAVVPKPIVEPTADIPAPTKPIVKSTPTVKPIEIAKVFPMVEPVKTVAVVDSTPEVLPPKATIVSEPVKSNSNDFSPLLTLSAKSKLGSTENQFPVPPIQNEFSGPIVPAQPAIPTVTQSESVSEAANEFVVRSLPANIDPLAGMNDLPDMSQIEQELAEFKKANTFDPSTIIETDRIDPAVLLAKLDGPPKKVVEPVSKVVEVAPNQDLIRQQLAAQSSALLELQDAIKQLKPEPVIVKHEEPTLALSNAAFCTKISGFGQFKPFAANNFSSSQRTLLYCEVENQTSKPFTSVDGSEQFETVLHGSIVIYDANDRVVQTAKFPAIKDIARQRRRDFYVYFPVQFNALDNGDYRLELSVEDVSGGETAVLRPFMRFSVR